jgi:hemoglobin
MSQRSSQQTFATAANVDENGSLYERIGGETIERLVSAFYARVETDAVIRRFYGKTLTCAIHGLTDFLLTWLGGPSVYHVRSARLRRRHLPFEIDVRARDAWLANMKAAMQDIGLSPPNADLLFAYMEYAADELVNSPHPVLTVSPEAPRPATPLANEWTRMLVAEQIFDAVSNGDLAFIESRLSERLVPHAELMSHALTQSLDPVGRADRRFGRRSKDVNAIAVVELLLEHSELDVAFEEQESLERFRHMQSMMEAYSGIHRIAPTGWPFEKQFTSATRDRFIREVERDKTVAALRGLRLETLLHVAASLGAAEFAQTLIHAGADCDANEREGHTPLYRAVTGEVALLLLAAGATVDVRSGPAQGTALHQTARHGLESVTQALVDHGAEIDALDAKGQTPLRRAVNCRKIQIVELLIRHGANPHAADRSGITPMMAARTDEMKQAMMTRRSSGD